MLEKWLNFANFRRYFFSACALPDVASWTRKIGVVIRKWVFASRIDSRKTSRCWSTNSVVRVSFLWSWGYSKGRRHQSCAEQNLVSSRDRGKISWNNTIRKVNRSGLAVVAGGIGRIVFGLPEEKCSEILKCEQNLVNSSLPIEG